jgi:hypothetical protein
MQRNRLLPIATKLGISSYFYFSKRLPWQSQARPFSTAAGMLLKEPPLVCRGFSLTLILLSYHLVRRQWGKYLVLLFLQVETGWYHQSECQVEVNNQRWPEQRIDP